jgi:hypothetical protein
LPAGSTCRYSGWALDQTVSFSIGIRANELALRKRGAQWVKPEFAVDSERFKEIRRD